MKSVAVQVELEVPENVENAEIRQAVNVAMRETLDDWLPGTCAVVETQTAVHTGDKT
jgi:hypothetical protein